MESPSFCEQKEAKKLFLIWTVMVKTSVAQRRKRFCLKARA
jgi:hypothetical protein